jgi:hypothetical protein
MTRRRLISLIAFAVLVAVLLGGGIYVRNLLLRQVSKRIQTYVRYSRIHLHVFPPGIVLDDIRTVSPSPYFSARQVTIELPLDSIFKSDKPLVVFVDQPVIRIRTGPKEAGEKGRPRTSLTLPFALAKLIVRNGEFDIGGGKFSYHAKGIQALLRQRGETYTLQANIKDNSLLLEPDRKPLEGKLSLLFESSGREVTVKKFAFSGPEVVVRANGSMTNLTNPEGRLRVTYRAKMEGIAGILGVPFDWGGRTEGEGEFTRLEKKINYASSFLSDDLLLNRVPLGRVRGRVEFAPGRGVRLDMNMLKGEAPAEFVRISYGSGRGRGELQGFHLDPILSYVSLPWPVLSPVWGNFTVDREQFVSNFEFRDEALTPEGDRYPFRGPVHFTWDRKKDVTFSSPRLETSFGQVELDGRIVIDRSMDISIKGRIDDVKSAREFTSLAIRQELAIPEIRGSGEADVLISGDYDSPEVKIDFNLSPAGFDRFNASAAEGTVVVANKTVRGEFRLNDPDLKGTVNLDSGQGRLNARIHLTDSSVQKVLTGLNIQLPLTGKASGDFEVDEEGENIEVKGTFSSSLMMLSGVELKEVTGKLGWNGDVLAFPELSFDLYEGKAGGSASIGFKSRTVEFDLSGQNINLALLSPSLAGRLSLDLKGKGSMGSEAARGNFSIKDLRFDSLQQMEAQGEVGVSLSEKTVGVRANGNFLPGENDFSVEARLPLVGDAFFVDAKGSFSNIDLLLPWKGAKGKLNYLAEVRGSASSPQITGGVDFQGSVLPFPEFAQAINDYSGLVIIKNNRASIRSFKGTLGGGELQGSGEITLGKGGIENLVFSVEGKDMVLSPFERTRALADASMTLIKNPRQFVLDGNFLIRRLVWRREISEKLTFYSAPYLETHRGPSFLDELNLNIHLKADDNAWVENSLGRIRCRFDLTLTGNVRSPILLGDIEAISGVFYFQDRTFQILRGRLSFFNPSSTEPYIDIKGETYVKDYRVTFTVTGTVSQLNPEFASSPPLPPEDVLALLSVGEAFKRPYSTETSYQMSTASLLSFTLTEEAQKRAQSLFSLDRFRIDPFLLGSSAEMTARLTLGKKISKDFFVYYSTNLTRQTEEIIRLEWDFSNEFSVVGTRNELGRYSVDVKIRKRF